MTAVHLSYGRHGLDVPLLGDDPLVVLPRRPPHFTTPAARSRRRCATRSAARRCASSCAGVRVAISVCDGTRAQPRPVMLPVILDELAAAASLAPR